MSVSTRTGLADADQICSDEPGIQPVRNDQRARLVEICRLSRRLLDRGVPVPVPLETGANEPFLFFRDKFIQILPFVKGQSFAGGEKQVTASGRMLRALHDGLIGEQLHTEPAVSFFRSRKFCIEALDRLAQTDTISRFGLLETRKAVSEVYDGFRQKEALLRSSILHGDWHFWNQLYDGGEVISVIDLDFFQPGPRILDIGYAMWMIHILLPRHAERYRRMFLSGYGWLTDDEIDMLPLATARIALFFLCHAADSHHPHRKWPKQYAQQMPFIHWLLTDGGERLRTAAVSV